MTIESPETYGEDYWRSSIDASIFYEEELEKSIKVFIPSLFADPTVRESMPFDILPKLEALLEFPDPGLAGVGQSFVSQVGGAATQAILNPALRKSGYAGNRMFQDVRIGPETAMDLHFKRYIDDPSYTDRMAIAGIGEAERELFFRSAQPYPTLPDWIRWARYTGNPENTWATLQRYMNLDPSAYPVFDWLGLNVLTTDMITALFKRGRLSDGQADDWLKKVGWSRTDVATVRDLSFVIPNAMLLLQSDLHNEASERTIFDHLGNADIHPDYRQAYIDAVLTKPNPTDIIAYHLREGNSISQIDKDLERIGIHPDYLPIYHIQTDRIPPLNDIITMAVREAFSPGTARRFGQYEDFPREFQEWAEKLGLSKEWAERYWAAHWGLPSATQGFDMLHRGIIDRGDLELLLKAQDVMPFWRDRLIEMAYRPLTRVDVRRMYALGVLNSTQVYNAFLKLGYDQENARNMTTYVIRQTEESMVHTARDDIVKAYTDRLINRSDAEYMLREIAIPDSLVEFMLDDAEYKRQWNFVDNQIKAIQNLYRKGEYDEQKTQAELLALDIPTDQVELLMQQWFYSKKAEGVKTLSKAETLKFFQSGMIDEAFARNELKLMGYDQTRIDLYMRSLTWESPTS